MNHDLLFDSSTFQNSNNAFRNKLNCKLPEINTFTQSNIQNNNSRDFSFKNKRIISEKKLVRNTYSTKSNLFKVPKHWKASSSHLFKERFRPKSDFSKLKTLSRMKIASSRTILAPKIVELKNSNRNELLIQNEDYLNKIDSRKNYDSLFKIKYKNHFNNNKKKEEKLVKCKIIFDSVNIQKNYMKRNSSIRNDVYKIMRNNTHDLDNHFKEYFNKEKTNFLSLFKSKSRTIFNFKFKKYKEEDIDNFRNTISNKGFLTKNEKFKEKQDHMIIHKKNFSLSGKI